MTENKAAGENWIHRSGASYCSGEIGIVYKVIDIYGLGIGFWIGWIRRRPPSRRDIGVWIGNTLLYSTYAALRNMQPLHMATTS